MTAGEIELSIIWINSRCIPPIDERLSLCSEKWRKGYEWEKSMYRHCIELLEKELREVSAVKHIESEGDE